jgi:Lar family restriction alleviation protein
MKYDLLPCPFCGGNCLELVLVGPNPYVACRDCEGAGPFAHTTGDEREAVTLWNTRRYINIGTHAQDQGKYLP